MGSLLFNFYLMFGGNSNDVFSTLSPVAIRQENLIDE